MFLSTIVVLMLYKYNKVDQGREIVVFEIIDLELNLINAECIKVMQHLIRP